MSTLQDVLKRNEFSANQLVTWRYRDEQKSFPIPAVVVRQEPDGTIVIKARVEDVLKEFQVASEQLQNR